MGAPRLSLQLWPVQGQAVPWLKPEGETRGEDFMGVRRLRETVEREREKRTRARGPTGRCEKGGEVPPLLSPGCKTQALLLGGWG